MNFVSFAPNLKNSTLSYIKVVYFRNGDKIVSGVIIGFAEFITTDLEESIEVEALTEYCLEELCNNYVKLGFVIHVPHPRVLRMRPENETPNTE